MNPDLHSRLLTDIEAVRSSVAKASLAAVVYRCFALLQGGPDSVLTRPLSAPMRQTAYLLGLALTRPEPPPESDLSQGEWDEINQRLERIYHAYFEMYLPGPDETPPENREQWFRVRDVSMPAFLHFHTQGTLATAEQVAARVRAVFGPFDDQFQSRLGLSASVAVEMAAWAIDRVQRQADLMSGMMRMYRRHHEERWDDARTRAEIAADPELQRLRDVSFRKIPFAVYRDDLAARFGAQHADAFWEFLVTQERGKSDFTYPTEENPATRRPLFQVAAGAALCPVGNWLFDALYEGFHNAAEQCGLKKRALSRRDAVLEEQVAVTVRSLFGPAAEYFREVYETPHSHHEHDLIVYWDRSLFVFEAKASPPVEPFRDPDRAFTRLLHAFRGDNGIQKAADQGGRVRRTLFESGVLRLYDQTGHLLREFPRDEVDEVFCVCVTADHHGPLATNLAFLLEKNAGDPYPWAVCVYDLEAFVGGLRRKGWGQDEFRRYLRERAPLHGKVFTDDELEIAGAYLLRGGLSEFGNAQADLVSVTPGFARVFDEIYMEPRSGRPPNLRMDTPVVLTDLRAELVRMASERRTGPVPHRPPSVRARIGRNDPCPCRSGRKFKRCCGINRG